MDSAEAAEDVRGPWREMAVARENPFLTPEWLQAWAEEADEEPCALVWRDSEAGPVRGVLPLVAARQGPLRVLRFPGAGNGDWFGAACRAEDEPEAIGAFLAHLNDGGPAWDVLRLDRVESGAAWRAGIEALWGRRGARVPRGGDVLPFIELGAGGYEAWLASRSRNFRSQLGRRRRRAERDHEVRFLDTPGEDGLDAAIDSVFELHDERRVDAGGAGRLPPRAQAAYRRFAALALGRGWLRIHTIELDGAVAAAWYGWRLGGRYCYGISGFDPGRGELALGTILLAHTIERAAEEGAEVYDLLWGDESYKSRYETGRRTVGTLAVGAGVRGRAALAAETRARALLARVRRR